MLATLMLILLTTPMFLSADRSNSASVLVKTMMDDNNNSGNAHKALMYNVTTVPSSRKAKRSNGEIPLLIIRPIEKKKKKIYAKEPMMKLMSGGVASYGHYPEIHMTDGEIFSLEHMLPILGLEGMVFKGMQKTPYLSSHFIPSPQFKPSDVHFVPQKPKEELFTPAQGSPSVSVSYKPTESVPVQSFPAPPPPNYVPAIKSEDALLKLGHQALSKLQTPGSPSYAAYTSSDHEKHVYLKPEQVSKYNYQKYQHEMPVKVKSVPVGPLQTSIAGAGYSVSQNEIVKHQKPSYERPTAAAYKYQEQPKKPQMVSPLSISTSFFYPKPNHNEEQHHQAHMAQKPQPKPYPYPHQPAPVAPQVTHVSYYFPKEIEPLPQPQPLVHHHAPHQHVQYQMVPANAVQNGEHIEYVITKQPTHEVPSNQAEKPYKQYAIHSKQKYQKQPQEPQSTYYIHKQFDFPGKPNSNENTVVTEHYGTFNRTKTQEPRPLNEPKPFAAPHYLPLPKPQPLAQPATTLHQTHPTPSNFHQNHQQQPSHTFQNHWKLGRRHPESVKPVVEAIHDSEPESSVSQQTVGQTLKVQGHDHGPQEAVAAESKAVQSRSPVEEKSKKVESSSPPVAKITPLAPESVAEPIESVADEQQTSESASQRARKARQQG
ncbi:uncharacterized protein LOC129756816 [Uranotaenia lowii]|uniref:uncharacterized protein LOC129756816 n=1 Tax=Uranotaenia lowii TaxID=190385 RepID=UPI0024789F9A|nr:uncharacterized protein LOC129756816 [Uranotaenia lowii]